MKSFGTPHDLHAAVGCHLGYGQWQEVTQQRIDLFADATGDHQWIHVDEERAAQGPFGATVAHGFLTLALLSLQLGQIYEVCSARMVVNYGLDRVRFLSPVRVGSWIRAGAELVAVQDTASGTRAHLRVAVEQRGANRPVCVAEQLALVVP